MRRIITGPSDRLIVAADFKLMPPQLGQFVSDRVLALADELKGTGVYLKVSSALRASGYGLIEQVRDRGLQVFADLKLIDIPETLSTDGEFLRHARPELLTVMCMAGIDAMKALEAQLTHTEILGVTVLTSLKSADTLMMFDRGVSAAVQQFAIMAEKAGIDGVIASPMEVEMLRSKFKNELMTINTPAIRPTWTTVYGDDQDPDRVMTPTEAIKAGADRIVVGRPILQAKSPRDAVMRTIDEIANALKQKEKVGV